MKEWFDREQKTIFSKTWQFAGFVEDIKDTGDFISVQVGLNNIFIIKGQHGEKPILDHQKVLLKFMNADSSS